MKKEKLTEIMELLGGSVLMFSHHADGMIGFEAITPILIEGSYRRVCVDFIYKDVFFENIMFIEDIIEKFEIVRLEISSPETIDRVISIK